MPRDEEGRSRARKQARFALITCIAMLAGITPLFSGFSVSSAAPAAPAQTDASASVSASASASARASASASATSSPSATQPPSFSPAPTATNGPALFTAPTDVTIKFKRRKHLFSGDLKSRFAGCEGSRKIKLWQVRKGPDRKAGKDTTGSDGSWSIKRRRAHGKYYAVGLPKTLATTSGDQIDCQKGKSKTIKV